MPRCVRSSSGVFTYIAIWTGDAPHDDQHGQWIFERLRASQAGEDAHPLLLSFVADVVKRYPDLNDSGEGVWVDGPLVNNVSGCLLYLGVHDEVDEVVRYLVRHARNYHLNVFDPKRGIMLATEPRAHDD